MTTRANYERTIRYRKTAETWVRKATAMLRHEAEQTTSEDVRAVMGWEAAHLIARMLREAETLVPLIEDDLIDSVERDARELVSRLRGHRLAMKLDRTEGRTEAEAAAFAEKAAELRR